MKTTIPDDFTISDQVATWAFAKGFDRLPEHLEWFIDYCLSNDKKYANYDAAFRNAIRGNWAKLTPLSETSTRNRSIRQDLTDISWAEH